MVNEFQPSCPFVLFVRDKSLVAGDAALVEIASILRFRLAFGQTGLQSFDINMEARLLMITGLGVLLAACSRHAPPSAPKTDLDRLQGTWNLTSAMQDGKALPDDKVKQTTIVFKGDTFRFPGSAEYATSREGTIKLDESKTPKE